MVNRIKLIAREIEARTIIRGSGFHKVVQDVRSEKLTYLSLPKIAQIIAAIEQVRKQRIQGSFIEAGCALGGSSVVIASAMPADRILYIYDVFGMIPAPSEKDPPEVKERYDVISNGKAVGIEGNQYYGYINDLKGVVKENLTRLLPPQTMERVSLVEGLIQNTMHIQSDVAFAHIDVDWYEPVMVSLQRIGPRLSIGGYIILDDYFDWPSCKQAVDEFIDQSALKFKIQSRLGNMVLRRIE